MLKLIKLSLFIFIACFSLSACQKEDDTSDETPNEECTVKVYYRGVDTICNSEDNSGAVELDSDGGYLVLSNFTELVDIADLEDGSPLYIEYENLDSTLFNSGVLCGPLIVAPVAELTCVSQ